MPGERVLIVEDEPVVQLHLTKILHRLGYRIAGTVASGEEAIESAATSGPDLVLMDIRLEGEMDGIDAARQLREQHGVAVVFLTAYADEETLVRARAAEPAGYIVKPFTEKDVQATLATALAKDQAVRRIQDNARWLTTILESIGDGVVVTDASGRISFMNRVAEELTGTSLGTLEGRPLAEGIGLEKDGEAGPWKEILRSTLADRRRRVLPDAAVRTAGGGARPVDLVTAPLASEGAASSGLVLILRDVRERNAAREQLEDLRRLLDHQLHFHGLIGSSPAMQRVFQQIREVALVDWTVLVEGETGTGKELVARAIHAEGPRRQGPFVAVNTAGLTESLLASQLFGHKKGAFTGASSDQKGLFDAADAGTLFLDEIGDVPLTMQSSLLRVLEEKVVTSLGTARSHRIDVRFLAATHRDLAAEVEAGRFRTDLLYRIRVARIQLPPLRDREGDLDLLASWFLDRAAAATGKSVDDISPEAWQRLRGYRWPGNVRELKSALEYAVIRCGGRAIDIEDLPPEIQQSTAGQPLMNTREEMKEALRRAEGNRARAARLLGISRATLYRRLAEYEIGDDAEGG